MASEEYLRFSHGIVGQSKYRAPEGWIDVRGIEFTPSRVHLWGQKTVDPNEVLVSIGAEDPVALNLFRAVKSKAHIASALLESRSKDSWIQWTLTDVELFDMGLYHPLHDTDEYKVTIRCEKIRIASGVINSSGPPKPADGKR